MVFELSIIVNFQYIEIKPHNLQNLGQASDVILLKWVETCPVALNPRVWRWLCVTVAFIYSKRLWKAIIIQIAW